MSPVRDRRLLPSYRALRDGARFARIPGNKLPGYDHLVPPGQSSPLVDIGNFLRFEDELPPGLSEAFVQGYLSNSIGLPDNWRQVAKLLDLAAMVNFLDDERDAPKTFQTAISVMEKTVESNGLA